MKDYKQVAEDVFRRRDEVIAENKQRRRSRIEIGISVMCCAAFAFVCFGIWNKIKAEPIEAQPNTSQGADVSLTDSNSGSGDTKYTVRIRNDPRCIPRHSNFLIGYHTKIDSYDVDKEGIYVQPTGVQYGSHIQAGDVMYSNGLIQAMEKYGSSDENGEIYYDVIIQFYKDGKAVESYFDVFESERDKFGVNFFMESNENRKFLGKTNATYDFLKNPPPSDEYGYYIWLRGDYLDDTAVSKYGRVYNHGDHKALFELEGADFCHVRGTISNIDEKIEEPEYSPENGTVLFSESLKKAIKKYGKRDDNGELYYQVIIEYYKDGKKIDTTEELWQSEREGGVWNNFESLGSDFGTTWEHHIWSKKIVDELESFKPSGDYGCVIYLYNAYFGRSYSLTDNVINGMYNDGVYIEETNTSMADDEIFNAQFNPMLNIDAEDDYYITRTGGSN